MTSGKWRPVPGEPGFEEAIDGFAPIHGIQRRRLVQSDHRIRETPRMREPQEYSKVAHDMSNVPPRGGGIPTRTARKRAR